MYYRKVETISHKYLSLPVVYGYYHADKIGLSWLWLMQAPLSCHNQTISPGDTIQTAYIPYMDNCQVRTAALVLRDILLMSYPTNDTLQHNTNDAMGICIFNKSKVCSNVGRNLDILYTSLFYQQHLI